jgi:phosphatidylcholine synthase
MRWVHPLRVVRLRIVTLAITVAWAVAAIVAVWRGFPAGPWVKGVLGLSAASVVALTFVRYARLRRRI